MLYKCTSKRLRMRRLVTEQKRQLCSWDTVKQGNEEIRRLAKSGRLGAAQKVFDGMPQRDIVSWTAIITGYVEDKQTYQAMKLFAEMRRADTKMDSFVISVALKACSNDDALRTHGKAMHAYAIKSGAFEASVFVATALLGMYAKWDGEDAMQVFDEMPQRNVVSWTTAVCALGRAGRGQDAVRCLARMRSSGVPCDTYTYAAALKACADATLLNNGREIHSLVAKSGLEAMPFVANTLATMYIKSGELSTGLNLLLRAHARDVVAWTSIIAAYMQIGLEYEAVRAFVRMRESSGMASPNDYTFSAVISACVGLGQLNWGKQLHGHVVRRGFVMAMSVANAIVTLYAKAGQLDCAEMMFKETQTKDTVSWSAIISGYCQEGKLEGAFALFDAMRRDGWTKANEFTLSSLVSSCACLAMLNAGQQVHARALVAGLEREVMVTSSLVTMYSNCGNVEDAALVFEERNVDEIVSWTAMINGYAEHGQSNEAIELFDGMLRTTQLRPDSVAFIGVLTACCHAGRVDLGLQYFKEMRTKYNVEPMKEHYGCIVDLLGKAGKIGEAEKIINEMPKGEIDSVVWTALMKACAARGDEKGTERAAAKVKELEPWSAGAHVVLANLYASKGRWGEVASERKMMRKKGVAKEAGWSSIGTGKDKTGVFVAGDRTHERMQEIYGMLDLTYLGARIAGEDRDAEFEIE